MSEPLFRKKELIILAVISILLAGIIMMPRFITPGSGTIAVVTYNGETAEISLDKPDTYTIEGDLTATLVVENGKIRFVNSKCPDKICEAFGWIGREGESAICAPARLAVQIINK